MMTTIIYTLRSPISTDAFSLTKVSIRRPARKDIAKVNASIRAEERRIGQRPSVARIGMIVVAILADIPLEQARRIGWHDMAAITKIVNRAFDEALS